LLNGQGFVLDGGPTIRRVPIYSVFLALLGGSGQNPYLIAGAQALLDATIPLMILALASLVVSRGWAIAAALTYAVHPGAIYQASVLLSESLFAWFVTAAMVATAYGVRRDRAALSLAGGILLAAAALTRPIGLVLLLAFPIALFVAEAVPRPRIHAALLFAGLLVILPWSARTSALAGEFVPLQSHGVVAAYHAARWDFDQLDEAHLWAQFLTTECGRLIAAAHDPHAAVAADAECSHEAAAQIAKDPRSYALTRIRVFPYLFIYSFDNLTGIRGSYPTLLRSGNYASLLFKALLLFAFALVPFILALISLGWLREHPVIALSAAVWGTTLVAHVPLWVQFRYWVPALPAEVIAATCSAFFLYRRLSRAARRPTSAGPPTGIALLV
jgi:4-amino-4-deoxy-L-arabinose transferase-like glycosyltransferase